MKLLTCVVSAGYLWMASYSFIPEAATITTGSLLSEMTDLSNLARYPNPTYKTIQFSSYDRRSTRSEAPAWFSNADGFGREPIPGFLKVLREPRDGGAGLYLVAEVEGPGAIVRGWSAGMGGILKVYLDPKNSANEAEQGTLIWTGPAYDFLARRSNHYLKMAQLELDAQDAFCQQDADYLPIPFASGLRVTWEGKLTDLHFYHLQVRRYPKNTDIRSFDPVKDLKEYQSQLLSAISDLTKPTYKLDSQIQVIEGFNELGKGKSWSWSPDVKGPAAIGEITFRVTNNPKEVALRNCLLRIAFDGSQRPQVEAPLGDFFASGPGINPFSSLPLLVETNGTMTCRFVMPFKESVRFEVINYSQETISLSRSVIISSWQWDDRSMYFRAKWRADHDLLAGAGAVDLPYLVGIGKGVFVGCAAMIMNPTGAPMAGGNWWGEGDEKILVDGESIPSTFGTGSEDYFNYSWSRPDLFDHPYCGQPLDSGPDTSGYVSNHRFQFLDAIPFEQSIAVLMELWSHNRTPGLSYARIAYHYARPNAMDDHRALMPADLKIPVLPKREPKALGAASGARFLMMNQLKPETTSGPLETISSPLATQHELLHWNAKKTHNNLLKMIN